MTASKGNGIHPGFVSTSLFGIFEKRSGFVPFAGGDLPYLAGVPAGDEVSLFRGDDAHASLLGDAARGVIADRFRSAQDRKFEDVEPEVVDGDDGLGHQALAMPREAEPEATIVGLGFMQADGADVVLG